MKFFIKTIASLLEDLGFHHNQSEVFVIIVSTNEISSKLKWLVTGPFIRIVITSQWDFIRVVTMCQCFFFHNYNGLVVTPFSSFSDTFHQVLVNGMIVMSSV
jgi:hypothetical protein